MQNARFGIKMQNNKSKCVKLPFVSHFSADFRLFKEIGDRYSRPDFCILYFQLICHIVHMPPLISS